MAHPTSSVTKDGGIRASRREQVFPTLDARQIAILETYGTRRRFPAGAVLSEEGQRHIGMFVILSGEVHVTRRTPMGDVELVVHGPGNFSGDVGQLTGRAAVATLLARTDTEVIVVEEEALHRLMVTNAELSELITRAFILRRMALLEDDNGPTIVGSGQLGDTHRLRQFLNSNAQPHSYLDLERDPTTAAFLEKFGVASNELPVVITGEGKVLRNPSLRDLADEVGLGPECLHGRKFDVAVVGAGPAGLAAAVYAASEGLRVVVFDARAPGGQAGTSSKIENYFGFPTGISGEALAGRGFIQAQKFGAEVAIPREVVKFECNNGPKAVTLDSGEVVEAAAVVISTGARYRKPSLAHLERFEGRGVYYAASWMEAQLCAGKDVIVVGGGNSAGQAAVFLAGHAVHVHMLVRATGLAASMSDYLVQRIAAAPNITLHTQTEIIELLGDDVLEGVRWRHKPSGATEDHPICHLFLFLGADPNTAWVENCVALDAAKFVKTGYELSGEELAAANWPLSRPPMRFETTIPGVFAVGDVRSGSVKRVAGAVGEGATTIQLVHLFLGENA